MKKEFREEIQQHLIHISNMVQTFRKQRMSAIYRTILCVFLGALLLVGCAEEEQTIDGMNFGAENERIKTIRQMEFEEEHKEKYLRHFNKEVYDEDWTSIEEELNAKFNQDLRERIDFLMRTKALNLEKMQYILKSEVEYVREDMKKYRDKELQLSEILTNPKSIMSMKIYLYGFSDPIKVREGEQFESYYWESFVKAEIASEIMNPYPRDGVEVFEFYFKLYDEELLDKYSFEDITKENDIDLFLAEEKT